MYLDYRRGRLGLRWKVNFYYYYWAEYYYYYYYYYYYC